MANETFDSDSAVRNSRSSYRPAIIAFVLLVLAGGSWYVYQTFLGGSQATALEQQFSWSLTPIETPISTQTSVTLRVANVDVPVGTFEGACQIIDGDPWSLLTSEVTGVVCQTDAGGIEIGVFDENGQLILKKGTITGSNPKTAERGNFAPIVSPS